MHACMYGPCKDSAPHIASAAMQVRRAAMHACMHAMCCAVLAPPVQARARPPRPPTCSPMYTFLKHWKKYSSAWSSRCRERSPYLRGPAQHARTRLERVGGGVVGCTKAASRSATPCQAVHGWMARAAPNQAA